MDEGEFSIEIPSDTDFYNALKSSLSSDPSIKFTESEVADFTESEGSLPDILACIMAFPTAAMLSSALKRLSPIILEFLKRSRQVKIKIDGLEIQVANVKDIERAITAANGLSTRAKRQQPSKSKKLGHSPAPCES